MVNVMLTGALLCYRSEVSKQSISKLREDKFICFDLYSS
jgi:hypothetical protein